MRKDNSHLPAHRIMPLDEFWYYNRMLYEDHFSPSESSRMFMQTWKDWGLFKQAINRYSQVSGPRLGDYVINGGQWVRLCVKLGTSFQTTPTTHDARIDLRGNFSIGIRTAIAFVSYSGGCGPLVYPDQLYLQQGREEQGWAWTFTNDYPGANRAVYCRLPFRVYGLRY